MIQQAQEYQPQAQRAEEQMRLVHPFGCLVFLFTIHMIPTAKATIAIMTAISPIVVLDKIVVDHRHQSAEQHRSADLQKQDHLNTTLYTLTSPTRASQ